MTTTVRVIKRDGKEVPFDGQKIINAIKKAKNDTPESAITESVITDIADYIEFKCSKFGNKATYIEDIQDMVEKELMSRGEYNLAKNYVKYRYERELIRKKNTTDDIILNLIDCTNEEVLEENSNKNPIVNSTQRDYIAGEVSRDITNRILLPKKISDAHKKGIIHFHDADYFIQKMTNCCLVNLEDMLQNGTVISKTKIDKPKSLSTAVTVTTQIMAQIASAQYGGQSISLAHIAPFVDVSRKKIRKQVEAILHENGNFSEELADNMTKSLLKREIQNSIQTMQYQIITLNSSNGQAPFVTVFIYLNEAKNEQEKKDLAMLTEEMFKQRMLGVKNEKGVYVTPAFPKIIYVLEEDNIKEGTPYWYLTELAAKCTAKRMVPDYISEKVMKELKDGQCYTCMGCRSFLTLWKDENGKYKFYGRENMGVVTINLPHAALSSKGDMYKFWQIMDERLELCYEALMIRFDRLKDIVSDYAPILWQHGALARLKSGEKITKYLMNGYATISLGYAGLFECTKYMTGESHTGEKGKAFALKVMQLMNDKCAAWKKKTSLDFSLYGTPLESTTYKFAKALQKDFGKIKDVSDHNYITNSYHINVRENIDAFSKLSFEAEFQKLSPGGCISYIECPNMENNIPALLKVLQHIYNTIMYAEINTKSDYCQNCGWDKEIPIVPSDGGKLIFKCPNCGCENQQKLNIARRTCGYIGTNFWNQGRTQEIKDRVMHL